MINYTYTIGILLDSEISTIRIFRRVYVALLTTTRARINNIVLQFIIVQNLLFKIIISKNQVQESKRKQNEKEEKKNIQYTNKQINKHALLKEGNKAACNNVVGTVTKKKEERKEEKKEEPFYNRLFRDCLPLRALLLLLSFF